MLNEIETIRNVKRVKELAHNCSTDSDLLNELLSLILKSDDRSAIVASWIVSHAAEYTPEIIDSKISAQILNRLKITQKGTIKRNLIRIFQYVILKGKQSFELLDVAFGFFENPKEEIAVRAFSLTCLEKHLDQFPEIIPEIEFIIEREYESLTPAFIARVRNFNKKIIKLNKLKSSKSLK
ncbi:MAG TPA: hypothetical protein VGF79_16355 [Bacteroidia bacterium]